MCKCSLTPRCVGAYPTISHCRRAAGASGQEDSKTTGGGRFHTGAGLRPDWHELSRLLTSSSKNGLSGLVRPYSINFNHWKCEILSSVLRCLALLLFVYKLKCFSSKYLLPLVSYVFEDGPWRDTYVRLGYDPRDDPDARLCVSPLLSFRRVSLILLADLTATNVYTSVTSTTRSYDPPS